MAFPVSAPIGEVVPERRESLVSRTIRDSLVAGHVKALYDCACQVCGIVLETGRGRYAEAAHIRPLGRPHNGPDTVDNVLCLCPNHHVLFDLGAFTVDPDSLSLIGIPGELRLTTGHAPAKEHLEYHRTHYGSLREQP